MKLKSRYLTSLWFMFLTFPIMVIRVNTIYKTVEWRWHRMVFVGVGAFFLSFLWRFLIRRKEAGIKKAEEGDTQRLTLSQRLVKDPRFVRPGIVVVAIAFLVFPLISSLYQIDIMTTGAHLCGGCIGAEYCDWVGRVCWTLDMWPSMLWGPMPTPC